MEQKSVCTNDQAEYEIIKELNRGSYGVVYSVLEVATQKKRAVKRMIQGDTEEAIKERDILSLLNAGDPQGFVIKCHAMLEDGDAVCLVFDLMKGHLGSWTKALHPGGVPLKDLQVLTKRLFGAFEYLGERGILHADIKPNNFLMESRNPASVKVADFGLARRVSEDTEMRYRRVAIPSYTAPEVILGHKTKYAMSPDIWALGCVLLFLLFCRDFFPVDDDLHTRDAREEDVLYQVLSLLGKPPEHMLDQAFHERYCRLIRQSTKFPLTPHPLMSALREKVGDKNTDQVKLLYDFIQKVLTLDPDVRMRPTQALQHPFLTST